MNNLCLFTNEFPYGDMEPYLETEIDYYKSFKKILIFALQLRKTDKVKKKTIPGNINLYDVDYAPRIVYFLNSITVLFDGNLYRELGYLKKSKGITIRRVIDLFVFLSRAHYEARIIERKCKRESFENSVFYSYRFEYQPYVAYLVKKYYQLDVPIVSRAHRYDLYENLRTDGYIPMRNILLELIDYVFPCSLDGKNYINSTNQFYPDKVLVKYLGTIDHGIQIGKRTPNVIKIVSCSTVRPVKRVNLILDAIEKITDYQVEWTHFGDGPLLDELKERSKTLNENIVVKFMGNIPNERLLNYYRDSYYDIFLNVSTSEGLPVSIMEAMSFGIPCIATDVGGTKEIVDHTINGVLLHEDSSPERIKDAILSIANMTEDMYGLLRENARKKWEKCFSSERNYKDFSQFLFDLK